MNYSRPQLGPGSFSGGHASLSGGVVTTACVQLLGDGRDCGMVASTMGGGRSDTIFPFKECSQDPLFLFSNSLLCTGPGSWELGCGGWNGCGWEAGAGVTRRVTGSLRGASAHTVSSERSAGRVRPISRVWTLRDGWLGGRATGCEGRWRLWDRGPSPHSTAPPEMSSGVGEPWWWRVDGCVADSQTHSSSPIPRLPGCSACSQPSRGCAGDGLGTASPCSPTAPRQPTQHFGCNNHGRFTRSAPQHVFKIP